MTVGTITTKLRKPHSDRIKFGVLIVKTNSVTNPFNHLVNGERSTGHTNVLDLFEGGKRVIHYGDSIDQPDPKSTDSITFFELSALLLTVLPHPLVPYPGSLQPIWSLPYQTDWGSQPLFLLFDDVTPMCPLNRLQNSLDFHLAVPVRITNQASQGTNQTVQHHPLVNRITVQAEIHQSLSNFVVHCGYILHHTSPTVKDFFYFFFRLTFLGFSSFWVEAYNGSPSSLCPTILTNPSAINDSIALRVSSRLISL